MQWLFEAKKRYGLCILNYIVTSNHIHLVVFDRAKLEVIPRSMQLIAAANVCTPKFFEQCPLKPSRKGAHSSLLSCRNLTGANRDEGW